MKRNDFEDCIERYAKTLGEIRDEAYSVHEAVNQQYGDGLPYGYHLDMVATGVKRYGHEVCAEETDVVPLLFGAWFHDSIEDARLTYNDVRHIARRWMDDRQATIAAEIVYALTNDKGRTRKERAGERYYRGIRETPYAPFVKLCDRLANITYSFGHGQNDLSRRMKDVYRDELPHFLQAISVSSPDGRFLLPEATVEACKEILNT